MDRSSSSSDALGSRLEPYFTSTNTTGSPLDVVEDRGSVKGKKNLVIRFKRVSDKMFDM